MPELTLKEVIEQHGGVLPPDAVLRSDKERVDPPPKPTRRPGRGGRFAALNSFVDFGIANADLTPAEALVWLVLFRDTKGATGTARTGQADIARRLQLDVRTVRRAVASLAAKGMAVVVRRGGLSAGPSVYRVRPTRDA